MMGKERGRGINYHKGVSIVINIENGFYARRCFGQVKEPVAVIEVVVCQASLGPRLLKCLDIEISDGDRESGSERDDRSGYQDGGEKLL